MSDRDRPQHAKSWKAASLEAVRQLRRDLEAESARAAEEERAARRAREKARRESDGSRRAVV